MSDAKRGWVLGGLIAAAMAGAGVGGVLLVEFLTRERPIVYDMSEPERTLESASLMVQNGDAGRLWELVETSSENEARLFEQAGRLLGAVQDLTLAIREEMPEDLERYREEMARAAAEGEPVGFFERVAAGRRGERERPPDQRGFEMFRSSPARARINEVLKGFVADPYAWIEGETSRISFDELDDDVQAVLWDGRMVLAPVGVIVRRQEDGRWQVVPPLRVAFVDRVAPRTDEEFMVWGSLFAAFTNVARELEALVREGRVTTLEGVADEAFERAAIPAAMIGVAFARVMEAREDD